MTLTKYSGREGSGEFRAMTLDEVKALRYGDHIWCLTVDRTTTLRVKVNGAVKRWKRNPDRVEVPFKYGLYEYGSFTNYDVESGRLLVEVSS